MVVIILLVLAVFVLQTLLPASFRYLAGPGTSSKLALALGSRDDPPPQTTVGGRAERALLNMHDMIVGTAASLALTGAMVFLIARLLYVPAYLLGIFGLRTLIWCASVAGLVMMLVPLLSRT